MKYRHLIFANLFRKKIRTTLTLGSFVVALFLFGFLAVVHGAFNQGLEVAGANRLVVVNKVSIIQPLPISYKDKLAQTPGVTLVTHANWFGGVYQDERNFFPQFAIEDETYRQMFPEFLVPDDQWKVFFGDRVGAVVGEDLVKRFHWKVGDRVPIKGTIFPGTWEFNIDGIYKGARPQDDTTQFWFHYKYLEERESQFWKGLIGWYTVRIDDPGNATRVAGAIDDTFANSPWETKTETEKAFAAGFVKQAGNIEFLLLSIGSVVFFTLLLVTGNTMAIAVRERMRELAVLKAVGFSDAFVLSLVLGEALFLAAIGGGLGLALCKLFTLRGDPTGGMMPYFYLAPPAIILGLLAALAVGVAAGILPAWSAMRLRVVDALRRV
ncbi:MAG TPA: FtsX-like permease family protein [Terriglobales bacterium]|nr:FtsX-like permease family protein [Terriglobales bacterium]